jgi:hypothetical protein
VGIQDWFRRRQDDSIPIAEFISDSLEAIKKSAGAQYNIDGTIKFELATTISKSGEGKLTIKVVGASSSYKKRNYFTRSIPT